MKNVLILFLLPVCFAACSGGGTSTPATTTAPAAKITFPYTAAYSSNFVDGKDSDILNTLNSYKAWETGDMAALKATIGDSIDFVFSDGNEFKNSNDSFVRFATKFRDSLSSVKIIPVAWTSNHSVDKNDDWVNVWYTEVDTYKTGKVDSSGFEDANQLKNGKIIATYSYMQKIKK